jgi:hypothetical protein
MVGGFFVHTFIVGLPQGGRQRVFIMVFKFFHMPIWRMVVPLWFFGTLAIDAQTTAGGRSAVPQVVVPTGARPMAPVAGVSGPARIVYPWKIHVTCTVFWIGEQPSGRNKTPNDKSSWDQQWLTNFGGYDDPEPGNRIANHMTGEFRPKGFVPKLNPFYIALPYNDISNWQSHKPEASRVIPWFSRMRPEPGKTVCKGRWIQIFRGGRSCYGQWEDCGPWETDDWEFVFGTKPPKTQENGAAGIDLSPAIRDYLGLKSGEKVHWRFVEGAQVPQGPWKKYGYDEPEAPAAGANGDLLAQQKYIERLRKMRDEQFLKKPLNDL